MRYIKFAFWAVVAVCLIVVGLANRGMVTLRLLPPALSDLAGLGPELRLPLVVVILLGVAVGLLIGFVWEWIREYKHRSRAARRQREVRRLEREVSRLKSEKHEGQDDVLALLEEPRRG